MRYLKQSVQWEPGYLTGYLLAGGVLERLGRLEEAEQLYCQVSQAACRCLTPLPSC